jgi:hypothetical protein
MKYFVRGVCVCCCFCEFYIVNALTDSEYAEVMVPEMSMAVLNLLQPLTYRNHNVSIYHYQQETIRLKWAGRISNPSLISNSNWYLTSIGVTVRHPV